MSKEDYLLKYSKRQHLRVLAFVLFLVGFSLFVYWGYEQKTFILHNNFQNTPPPETIVENTLTAPPETPVLLRIPSANITAPFEGALPLNTDGSVGVPKAYDTVGWFKNGPLPGEIGPSVVLGHVDSYEGPAVFFYLGQVHVGDEVYIDREDGSVLTFTITHFERIEQEAFPTDRVYGEVPYAGLRLITCSGTYDRSTQTYSHNLIVYANLTNYTPPKEEL